MWLFALFLAVPLIEIALFIQVGGWIGLWPTLLIVVLTAVLGTFLVRSQGAAEISRLRRSLDRLEDPTQPIVHGAMILFSGALLLTPGFFTDAVGFALLVPGIRTAVFRWVRQRVNVQSFSMGGQGGGGGSRRERPGDRVVDAEYTEVDPEKRATHVPSEWTRH